MRIKVFIFMIVLSAFSCGKTVKIYLVRHAEKEVGENADAIDPPLSKAGFDRALALADILKHQKIKKAFYTEFLRTIQTATPTITQSKCLSKKYDASDMGFIYDLVDSVKMNILIVGHSNTLLPMLDTLGIPHKKSVIESNDYDNLFLIKKRISTNGRATFKLEEKTFKSKPLN